MRLDDLTTPTLQRAIQRGRHVTLLPDDYADPTPGLWLAPSDTQAGVQYAVRLWQGTHGPEGSCTCPAGSHDRPCKHLGAALLLGGQARWWSEIVFLRTRAGRPQVWLVAPDGDSDLLHHSREVEWGFGGAGPWWLATLLVRACWPLRTDHGPLAVRFKEDHLERAPWVGFRLSARGLDRWLARVTAESRERVPA